MCRLIAPFFVMFSVFQTFAGDLIVDRKGNEISCSVDSISTQRVYYRADSAAQGAQTSLSRRDVFMVKYGDGRKVVIGGGVAGPAETVDSTHRIYCAILGDFGTFGLFNVDWKLTKADYSAGLTPYAEIRFARQFAIGAECIVLWGQPATADKPRLLIDPSLRFKALFPVHPRLRIEPLIAAGVSWWPADKASVLPDSTLSPTLLDNRFGWNARAALGFDFAVTPRFSIILEAGYSASSSESRGIWITHDMMLVSIGPKLSF